MLLRDYQRQAIAAISPTAVRQQVGLLVVWLSFFLGSGCCLVDFLILVGGLSTEFLLGAFIVVFFVYPGEYCFPEFLSGFPFLQVEHVFLEEAEE